MIPCGVTDDSESKPGTVDILHAGMNTIAVPDLPADVGQRFVVSIAVSAEDDPESWSTIKKEWIVRDSSGSVIHRYDYVEPVQAFKPRHYDWPTSIMWIETVGFNAPVEGTYAVEYRYGDLSHTTPVRVLIRPGSD